MLRDVVLVSAESLVGFATDSSDTLVDEDGALIQIDGSPMRVAHPLDLLRSGRWPAFQHVPFAQKRKQPFRQLFRELYTMTDAERDTETFSHRYAGHQIQSRQAGALFRTRGWIADFEVGFGKTFHQEKLTAWCSVLDMFGTPGDVEDGTVQTVSFHSARSWQPNPLEEVPPRLFSEVMRDLDLVVSVAHAGGVDPESSASTVEMRACLVAESCDLLSLTNVETTGHHALVKGKLATYSDPRIAEVISKIVMLPGRQDPGPHDPRPAPIRVR